MVVVLIPSIIKLIHTRKQRTSSQSQFAQRQIDKPDKTVLLTLLFVNHECSFALQKKDNFRMVMKDLINPETTKLENGMVKVEVIESMFNEKMAAI